MIVYAKDISDKIRLKIKNDLSLLYQNHREAKLVVILVGNDSASQKYVQSKKRACQELGIQSEIIVFEDTITETKLLTTIQKLNMDQSVDGILVQLPLPKHIDVTKVTNTIHPLKDVDGFHPQNLGNLFIGNEEITPCTPKGIISFFESQKYDLTGKHVVIVGRSTIVSKPLVALLLNRNATVTITHSKTVDLKKICRSADVIIVAVGKAKMIDETYIGNKPFIIDVGINIDEHGKLCGDVDFERVKDLCGYITPVPKGVGVMTITMLLENTYLLYKKHTKENKDS